MKDLQVVALRNGKVFTAQKNSTEILELKETTAVFIQNINRVGFSLSEDALIEINHWSLNQKQALHNHFREVTGIQSNWTPLVKEWNVPTNESIFDHIATFLSNLNLGKKKVQPKGTVMPCGHFIPDNTFPIERYNGCPYCGTPFEFSELDYKIDHTKLKVLELWTIEDFIQYRNQLIASNVPLDATQFDNLRILLSHFPINKVIDVPIKENQLLLIDELIKNKFIELAGQYFKTPKDILRFLWYKKTGFKQIVPPKIIAQRIGRNSRHIHPFFDASSEAQLKTKEDLKLKFSRPECRMYANWLNQLPLSTQAMCENMHTHRGMWVRIIRALRLAEFAKKTGFEKLKQVLDNFYNETYFVFNGRLQELKLKDEPNKAFSMLKKRPGLFSRSLFSTMLWFGPKTTITQFEEVINEVTLRLILSLNMYADTYFEQTGERIVKTNAGNQKRIPKNKHLQYYSSEDLLEMRTLIKQMTLSAIQHHFKQKTSEQKSIYIDKQLQNVPVSISDRSEHIQEIDSVPMGARFPIEGNEVRLFMNWGEGLPAQHLDMDLSCRIIYPHSSDICSYHNLSTQGCQHSGDIQHIPNKVGTAEYIEIKIDKLKQRSAKYVLFSCNAYTYGALNQSMKVGWMDSKFPMTISPKGVAYNPTQVTKLITLSKSTARGLVFGVLDIENKEVIWLEFPFGQQIAYNLDLKSIELFIERLNHKLKVADILQNMAESQGHKIVSDINLADEVYDLKWASNLANVNELIFG